MPLAARFWMHRKRQKFSFTGQAAHEGKAFGAAVTRHMSAVAQPRELFG